MTPLLAAGNYEQVWGLGIFLALHILALLPLGLLFTIRWPDAAPMVTAAVDRHRVRTILAGATMTLVTALLGGASAEVPVLRIPLVIALVGLAGFAFVGLVAEARRTGLALLRRPGDSPGVEARATAIGWLTLAGAALFPLVGMVVVVYLAVRGAGAALLAAARRSPPADA